MTGALHLTPEERAELPDPGFEESEIGYRVHRDVVVLRTGICLKRGLILKDSVYRIPRRYPRFAMIAYGSRLSRRVVPLDPSKTYAVIHNLWSGGYYHWVTESLARLRPIAHLLDGTTVLLPSSTLLTGVMEESLRCFGVRDIEFFPPEVNVFVRRLVLPANPPRHREVSRASVEFVRSNVLRGLGPAPGGGPERVFISRARARARRIVNEEEVAALLASRGYVRVFTEEMGFAAQVRLMQGARAVVSQHGAGLTNLVFMRPGASVLEIARRAPRARGGSAPPSLAPTYPRLALHAGLGYHCLLCDPADPSQVHQFGDVVVDPEALAGKLDAIEGAATLSRR